MPRKRTIKAADLFCGAGGTSTGLHRAAEARGVKLELVAVNHWERAVETHAANHPKAAHHCEDLTTLDPRKAVPGGKLDILVASPECTHHSVARGGMPMNDQSRASAWCVLRWATALRIDQILIENVPEFVSWGPIGANGRPLKSRKGETFTAFVSALQSLGYRVETRVLNSADHAAATSRRRLFLRATLGRRPINWPEPTHAENPTASLLGCTRKKWRGAREIINWQHKGTSIYGRKRPLVMNTLKRIEAGLRKFGGPNAEPFLVVLRNHMDGRSVDDPLPTLAAGGQHVGLCEPQPFLLGHRQFSEQLVDDIDRPIRTLTASNGGDTQLVEPFITTMNFTGSRAHDDGYSIDPDDPLPTITSQGNRFGLVEPFVMRACNGGDHNCRNRSIEEPLGTIHAGGGSFGVVEPFLTHITHHGGDRVHDLDNPLPTITTAKRGELALVDPFLVSFYGNDRDGDSVNEPLRTVTTKDRHGLVQPQGVKFDILFRMLEPDELKQGMGFGADYRITGNREEQVRQIGNAVEVNQAAALGGAMLEGAAA